MKIKKRLGVNIDHVATIRNARGEKYPDPLRAALLAEESGADSITIHLREDRRHIRDYDLKNIKKKLRIPLNLEIAPTNEMIKIALRHRPDYVCIVPEKRQEITTEGGLNIKKKRNYLKKTIDKLKGKKIRVALFIEPKIQDVILSKKLGSDCVELHTGNYCRLNLKKRISRNAFLNIKKCAYLADRIGLEVHAGHGLTYNTAYKVSRIKNISEFNIGHFIVSESIFIGLKNSIFLFKKIINK